MRVLVRLLLVLLVVYGSFNCARPQRLPTSNPLDIARQEDRSPELLCRREIYILFDSRFSQAERLAMEATYPEFRRIGLRPTLRTTASIYLFNLYVLRWDGGLSTGNIGLYEYHSSFIRLDADSMESTNQLQSVFMHETGHWLGMQHVCTGREALQRTDCSPVGRGAAIMNPFVNSDTAPRFSALDKYEFYRANGTW